MASFGMESARRQSFCADDTDHAEKTADTAKTLVWFVAARECLAPSNQHIAVSALFSAGSASSA